MFQMSLYNMTITRLVVFMNEVITNPETINGYCDLGMDFFSGY